MFEATAVICIDHHSNALKIKNYIPFQNNVTSFSDSFGNVSRVVGVYEAPNGVVMKLDGVLSPPPPPDNNPMVRSIRKYYALAL